ncbi:MAG: DUF4126 domain-containing protein [Verrucomicrobiota bacterium]|nr:DUF4126 domain-containing protein [Verrucomicrobiota bacterium]
MQITPETVLAAVLGIALSATCGLRIFVPFLVVNLASRLGIVSLSDGMAWMGTTTALVLFSVATVIEVVAYYFPVVDNALDVLTTPTSTIAGTLIAASFIQMDPWMKWSLALIAGGGMATVTQLATAKVRLASTAATGGFGNFIIATIELLGSVIIGIISVAFPVLGLVLVFLLIVVLFCMGWTGYKFVKWMYAKMSGAPVSQPIMKAK